MSPIADNVAAFLDGQRVGVLATVSADGRPRQSLVYYARQADRLLISTVAGRWKAKDVERDGWASLAVRGSEPPFPSVTVGGPAAILTENVPELTALVAQRIMDLDEPPEPQPAEVLAEAGRVILAIEVERVGPAMYLEEGRE